MPVRHEDDYRRRQITDWDTYIEDAITEAQARGEFDNLPLAGKPIRIQSNPHAPELDFAMSRLRNAGYKPTWMELDEEIKAGQEELQQFLDRSAHFASLEFERVQTTVEPESIEPTGRSWWRRLLDGPSQQSVSSPGPMTLADVRDIVQRMRAQYLERAATLDKRIGTFNAALSRDLWHLERVRLTQERASAKFDAAFSGVGNKWNDADSRN